MPGEMSFQPTGQVGHAVSAIMAETGAAGQASVAAIAESSRSSAALFLAARQAQLAAAAADVIAAAEDGSAAALSRPLRRFETLTTALWTVQFEVCAPGASPPRPALAAGASARAAVTASAGLPGYQFGPLFGPAPGLDGLGDGGVSPGFCPLDAPGPGGVSGSFLTQPGSGGFLPLPLQGCPQLAGSTPGVLTHSLNLGAGGLGPGIGGSCLRPGGCDGLPGLPGDQFGPLSGPTLGLGGVSGSGFGQMLVSFPGPGLLGGQAAGHVLVRLAHRHHAHGRPRPAGPDHPDPWP